MAQSLSNRNAIVTGGSGGIGLAVCEELAKRGCNIAVTYNSNSRLADDLVDKLKAKYNNSESQKFYALKSNALECDKAAKSLVEKVHELFTSIDIIVNSAGIDDIHLLEDVTLDDFDRTMKVNVYYPVFLVKEAVKYFGEKPRIVNVSSISARVGGVTSTVYSSSKAALEGATRVLAQELGQKYGATVNCVNPGPVNTKMWTDSSTEIVEGFNKYLEDTPSGCRIGEPDDIAQIIAFLCEEGCRWVNGSTVCANGGFILN
ncbi:unnamed protein product [[Candida] boidinii]|uniref:Unnamed protein product n=1 Tax=Candida boidinii TaxID=5477 RepID=A0A9W6WFV6_CANBO|nr:hypothetical protein BVG19_g1134 [[Candida] boidinii]OWB50152.1 hypothetical protein B5S27_g1699 [[Candida] boidinii]OWB64890.1 hypothetical protein B5S30_g211 [[Candida] boidinii]GME69272.1 unnamed protein product [[Candida] boidinii]GMF97869.1 unnamed protein product [[Candida] boidinii]